MKTIPSEKKKKKDPEKKIGRRKRKRNCTFKVNITAELHTSFAAFTTNHF